jgi:cystathionine beta-lyase
LAALEGGTYALAFASGQAASAAVLQLLEPGDEIVTTLNIYGGTYRLFYRIFDKYGITVRIAETTSPESLRAACTEKTAMVWSESPSNPLLTMLDIGELATRLGTFRNKKGTKPLLIVDNTFPSPALQNPLALGADIVVHSCTKYIGGHSDVIAGRIVLNDTPLSQQLSFIRNGVGSGLAPMDCYLLQRGVRTLPLRMKKHEENAYAVAEFLQTHPQVEQVFFPGFPDHPGHAIVAKQMRGLPGIVSFRMRGKRPQVEKFLTSLRLILLAESLGGVESLACHPASMTHAAFPETDRQKIGITENLVRLSLGIEDSDDLIDDLRTALS